MFSFNALKNVSISALALGLLSAVQAQDCTRNATVIAGDTCDAISQRYATSTYQLAQANPSIDVACSNLQIGQELCLGLRGSDCTKIYVVVPGDTCDGISGKYGLDDSVLYTNNPQIDSTCSNVYVGEILCVDTNTFSYTMASASSSSIESDTSTSATVSPSTGAALVAVSTGSATVPATQTVSSLGQNAMVVTTVASGSPSAVTAQVSGYTDVEYCDDDDESEDCVPEDELPYCDDQ